MRCLSSTATPLAFALLLLAVVWISTPAASTPTPDGDDSEDPNSGNAPSNPSQSELDHRVPLPCEMADGSVRAKGSWCYGYFGDSILNCAGGTDINGTITPCNPSPSGEWLSCQEVPGSPPNCTTPASQASQSVPKRRFSMNFCQLFEGLKSMKKDRGHDHKDDGTGTGSAGNTGTGNTGTGNTGTGSAGNTGTGNTGTGNTGTGSAGSAGHDDDKTPKTYCVGMAGTSTVTCPGNIINDCGDQTCTSTKPMDGTAQCAATTSG